MRDESRWYKMLVASVVLHVLIIGAFSIPHQKTSRKANFSYYSVNLVSEPASGGGGGARAVPAEKPQPSPPPVQKKTEPKKPPLVKEKPQKVEREHLVSTTNQKSLAPKKKGEPLETTKDEVRSLDKKIREMEEASSLDRKIREMRSHTKYMDVSGGKEGAGRGPNLPGSGSGGGLSDPVLQKYYEDVWERIQESWHSPNVSVSKNLLAVVSIKIRKDGRISDWNMEQRSGNRAYDESIVRALKSIDMLPPLPVSVNEDYLEVGFNFHPPSGGGR